MKPFTIQLTRAATDDLEKLEEDIRSRILKDVATLQIAPVDRPPRVKRLKGFRFPLYRLRSGDLRILYRIDGSVVTVMRLIDRKDLDRTLGRLR